MPIHIPAEPTAQQAQALQRYADRHGRNWKSSLCTAWVSRKDELMADAGLLRQVRNTLGPKWLYSTANTIKPQPAG